MPQIKTYIDLIILSGGHSMILGHKPEKITLEQVAMKLETEKQGILENGLFDNASPNFHTYYPDVKPEDLKPSPESFIRPTFRALSEVIVHKKWNPVDFSKKGVLKASMPLLQAQTLNIDHESSIGNAIGSVSAVAFQGGYTAEGIKVPPGINVDLLIDGKSHPNIARKIMMKPPAIHSCSVTVRFEWEPSHKFENVTEFMHKVGQFGEDGKLIRRIVTKILGYSEISLVAHGADPFAKLVGDDGKILNPHIADAMESLSAQGKEKPQHYFFNYKTDVISNSIDVDDTSDSNNNNNPTHIENLIQMKEYLLKLAASLNIENHADMDEAALKIAIDAAQARQMEVANSVAPKDTEITKLKADLEIEKTANKELKEKTKDMNLENLNDTNLSSLGDSKLEEVIANAEVGTKAMALQKIECIRLYKVLKGDTADEVIINGFDKADFAMLTSYINDYSSELNKKFPGKCEDCQSTNITRNSSISPAPGITDGESEEATEVNLDDAAVAELFNAGTSGGANNLHGVIQKEAK